MPIDAHSRRRSDLKPADSSVVSLPHLVDTNWRVDVTITTSEQDKVLKPTGKSELRMRRTDLFCSCVVLMRLTDSTGEIRQMEITPETFHHLRYAVARLLKVPLRFCICRAQCLGNGEH
jgi:hypothetical protein